MDGFVNRKLTAAESLVNALIYTSLTEVMLLCFFVSSQPNDTDVSTHNSPSTHLSQASLHFFFSTEPNLTSSAPAELCEVNFTPQLKHITNTHTHSQRAASKHAQTCQQDTQEPITGRRATSHTN